MLHEFLRLTRRSLEFRYLMAIVISVLAVGALTLLALQNVAAANRNAKYPQIAKEIAWEQTDSMVRSPGSDILDTPLLDGEVEGATNIHGVRYPTRSLPAVTREVASVPGASEGPVVTVEPGVDHIDLSGQLQYFGDPTKKLDYDQVRTSARKWTSADGKTPNLGFTPSAYWFRIQLRGKASERVYLEMPYVVVDQLEFFVDTPPGGVQHYLMGDTIPNGGRVIALTDYVVPVELRPDRPTWVHIRAETEGSLQMPLKLWRADPLYGAVSSRVMFYAPIFGLLAMLLIYNLFLFVVFREASYGYLSACVIGAALYLAYFTGAAQAYVFTDNTWLANNGYPLAMTATHLPMWLFTRRFLDLPTKLPGVDKGFLILTALAVVTIPLSILAPYRATLMWVIALVILGVLFSNGVGVYLLVKGSRSARYYVLGWSLFFLGIVVFAAEKASLLPASIVTNNVHVVGYVATLLVLPLGLADRINVLREEKEAAQSHALELQSEMSANLEREVERKTADLAERNEQLQAEIEHRERTEQERSELERSLFQSQKMDAIGRLAGGVAHDMNNMLAVISQTAESVQLDLDDPRNRNALDDVLAAAKRGGELARNLLGFARRGQYQTARLSLNKAIKKMYRLLRRTIHQGVEIDLELAPDLADVEADPNNINQILLNLAVNAAWAMDNKGVLTFHTRTITIGQSGDEKADGLPKGRYVCLEVSDTGVGMDDETMTHVFEPFFTTKASGEGTGLGLSMVYGAVQAHGGQVVVKSAPGQGATFQILLPALEPDTTAPRAPEPRQLPRTVEIPQGAVLLVDDEKMLRRSTSRLLQRMGYQVLEAEHGEQALEIFARERERIVGVLLDLVMPVMDGPETFRRLRELDPDLKVVLSSGFSQEGQAAELLKAGAVGFLQKPYGLAEVRRAIEIALSTHASARP